MLNFKVNHFQTFQRVTFIKIMYTKKNIFRYKIIVTYQYERNHIQENDKNYSIIVMFSTLKFSTVKFYFKRFHRWSY